MIDRLRNALEHPRLGRVAFVLALLLTLPSLSDRMVFDDYVLGLQARGEHDIAGFQCGPFGDLFTFTTGKPELNQKLMSEGALLPWWTDPQHLNAFLRPLSSLTHRFDFAFYPDHPLLMHLHSWLWFAALLMVARKFFASIESSSNILAAVGFLLFAIDDPHGSTLSWISNRNAIVALTFGMAAVVVHCQYVRAPRMRDAMLAPGLFALGLLGGEAAMAAAGYLIAHALTLEEGSIWRRLLRLWPYALIIASWRLSYRIFGLGSLGSDGYHDPLREPAAFILSLAQNLPILLGAQLSFPFADLAFWGNPQALWGIWLLAIAVVIVIGVLVRQLLRERNIVRFYALGMTLAAVPVSASIPGQRLLLGLSFGAAGLLAHLLMHLASEAKRSNAMQVAFYCLALIHVPFSASALPFTSRSMTLLAEVVDPLAADLPSGPRIRDQTAVIVNAPFTVFASYVQPMRAYQRKPRPEHLYWLASSACPTEVSRDSERSLVVTPDSGFLISAQDRHYRSNTATLSAGSVVALQGMKVTILHTTEDGRPASARFTFPTPLEDQSLAMFEFSAGHYQPWKLPAVGESRHFAQRDLFRTLARHVLSGE